MPPWRCLVAEGLGDLDAIVGVEMREQLVGSSPLLRMALRPDPYARRTESRALPMSSEEIQARAAFVKRFGELAEEGLEKGWLSFAEWEASTFTVRHEVVFVETVEEHAARMRELPPRPRTATFKMSGGSR
jgi:hypothetical protein